MARHLNRRTKRGSIIALSISASLLLAGCAGGGSSPSSTDSSAPLAGQTWAVGAVLDASPMFKSLSDGIVAEGKTAGAKMLRYDNNVNAATEVANGNLMVQQGAQFAINWAAGGGAEALGAKYKAAKIPCIGIGTPIPNCSFYNINTEASGTGLAKAAIDETTKRGWDPAKTTALLVSCLGCGGPDHESLEYFYSTYAAAYPDDFKQLKPDEVTIDLSEIGDFDAVQIDGLGSLEGAYDAVSNAIQSIPAGNNLVVYANNDDMATGTLRAIDQAGRTDQTILVTQGSTKEALDQVRDPDSPWTAEYSLFFDAWPKYLVAMGLAMQDGVTPPDTTKDPGQVITADNIDEWFDADGKLIQQPPVPKGDEYLKPYLDQLADLD